MTQDEIEDYLNEQEHSLSKSQEKNTNEDNKNTDIKEDTLDDHNNPITSMVDGKPTTQDSNAPSDESMMRAVGVLIITQLIGWITMCCVVMFWTTFTAVDIFNGDPTGSDTTSFENGVVFGVFGLLLKSVVSVNCSLVYPWINRILPTRVLFLIGEFGMAIICILFFYITNDATLLILISLFGIAMQLHLQTCQQIADVEFARVYEKLRSQTKTQTKNKQILEYILELGLVIAPVTVALLGGPVAYAFNGQFKWIFFIVGCVLIIFSFFVSLIFFDVCFWKLPKNTQNQNNNKQKRSNP